MLNLKHPALQKFWYPVMPVARIEDRPVPFTLLGEHIVLWRANDGSIACIKNRCVHEGARFSAGYIDKGDIVCPLHEWAFGPDGRCTRIPGSPDPDISNKIALECYRAREKYGYVWVALDETLADVPDLHAEPASGLRQTELLHAEYRIDAGDWIECAIGSAGPEFNDFEAKPSGHVAKLPDAGNIESEWRAPFIYVRRLRNGAGASGILIACATPIAKGKSMITQWSLAGEAENFPAELLFDIERTISDAEDSGIDNPVVREKFERLLDEMARERSPQY